VSPEARLRDLLAARGWPWLAPIEHHRSLHSTNDRLKELARVGAPEGSVVWADAQTAGRGRHGRSWVSPPGNLYVSVLLRPASACAPLLPLAAGVAVAEGLEALGVSASLKWPNDVVIGDRKLGGILAESSSAGSSIDWVVVGIGVNVRAPLASELGESAVSVVVAGASSAEAEDVGGAVLARLGVWYHRLAGSGQHALMAEWRLRSVPWWGQRVEAWSSGSRIVGRALGVDDEGGLVLEMDDGSKATLRSGEVSRCRPVS
jgi:BirA family transcriptional regulator, biotin operon repressor / biotin---[acetyl-CoA-carboxylase] ligase